MKNKFKRKHYKKGMTYVEVLVALSILALIVVVFTPVLMYSYENLYRAGEINVDTYEIKSYIEESLAVRNSNDKVKPQFGLQGVSEQINLVMRRIKSDVDGLETMYGVARSGITFLGEDVLIDNTSSHQITIQFTDFEDMVQDDFTTSLAPTGKQISYEVTAPLKESASMNSSQYSIIYDSSTKSATLTITGVDITYSPLKITIRFIDGTGRVRAIDKYIDIKPANMMFVGKANGTTSYYTTAGFDEENVFSLEARKMEDGNITGNINFNKITWVSEGTDNTGPIGYYAMCGSSGYIRRLWYDKKDGHNRYVWSGDDTEVYTYGASYATGTVSDEGVRPLTEKGTNAATYINYNGMYLDSGISIKNCIQISNNISTNAEATNFLATSGKEGMYFYTSASDRTYGDVPVSYRPSWIVNWEDEDKMSPWSITEGVIALGGPYKEGIWANYITGDKYNAHLQNKRQPVVFFSTVTAGDKDKSTTGSIPNKGGLAEVKDATKQIDSMFLMTDNQTGRYYHKTHWRQKDANGTVTEYGAGANKDVAARFTEVPEYPEADEVKFKNGIGGTVDGTVPDIENGPFTETQKKMLRYIINNFSDGVRVLNSDTKSFSGKTDITALDVNIPYIRLKGYTNVKANSLNSAFATLTAKGIYGSILSGVINNPNAQTISGQTSLELTDMCYINNGEKSSINYLGYSPASAYIYSTVLTSVHKDASGNNSAEKGYMQPYVIMGTDGKGYEIAELPVTQSHHVNAATLPANTKTGKDTDTAFTLGYSSNRGLLFTSILALEDKYQFQSKNVEDSSIKMPDEFTTYLSYAQDGDITLAVGYTTKGSVEVGKFSTPGGCTDHGLTSTQIGSRAIYIDNKFFYNTEYRKKNESGQDIPEWQWAFKNVNEDLNIGTGYCRGYALEAANPAGNNAKRPTSYVLQATNCAATYTKLGMKESAVTDQPITNAGVIAVHFAGDTSFRTIFVSPSTDSRLSDSRFTCADIGTTTVVVNKEEGTTKDVYKAYIGDSKGNVWCIESFEKTDLVAALSDYTVGNTLLDSAGTGMSSITKIHLSGNRLIIIGESSTDNKKTKMIIVEQKLKSSSDPEDPGKNDAPEGELLPPTIALNMVHSYTLYDVAENNGVFYAIGTTTSGNAGIILHTTEPTDSSVGWTAVTTAQDKTGISVPLEPLYSFAATGSTAIKDKEDD